MGRDPQRPEGMRLAVLALVIVLALIIDPTND